MKQQIKKLWIPMGILLTLVLLLTALPVKTDAEIYDKVIRLHVLANSDSEEDQALKLKVRDSLLVVAATLTEGCERREEAEAILKENAEILRQDAEATLSGNGSELPVRVEIGRESYPTREYEGLRLPAGEYCSLRVMIGEAEGQNWWCVLFPPLCLGTSVKVEEEMVSVGFTPGQVKVLTDSDTPKYRLRFKILEILGSLFS